MFLLREIIPSPEITARYFNNAKQRADVVSAVVMYGNREFVEVSSISIYFYRTTKI